MSICRISRERSVLQSEVSKWAVTMLNFCTQSGVSASQQPIWGAHSALGVATVEHLAEFGLRKSRQGLHLVSSSRNRLLTIEPGDTSPRCAEFLMSGSTCISLISYNWLEFVRTTGQTKQSNETWLFYPVCMYAWTTSVTINRVSLDPI